VDQSHCSTSIFCWSTRLLAGRIKPNFWDIIKSISIRTRRITHLKDQRPSGNNTNRYSLNKMFHYLIIWCKIVWFDFSYSCFLYLADCITLIEIFISSVHHEDFGIYKAQKTVIIEYCAIWNTSSSNIYLVYYIFSNWHLQIFLLLIGASIALHQGKNESFHVLLWLEIKSGY